MAYSLRLHESRVTHYLRHFEGLSREARNSVFANLHNALGEHGDSYRSDMNLRLAPGSPCFRFDLVIRDDTGDGRFHQFLFVVNDSAAEYGVLFVEYADLIASSELSG
jgi:hypothetical protein